MIDDEITHFLLWLRTERPQNTPHTLHDHAQRIRDFFRFSDVLTTEQIKAFKPFQRLKTPAASTLNKYRQTLRAYADFKGIQIDWKKAWKMEAEYKQRWDVLTIEELKQFCAIHTTDVMDMYVFMYGYGGGRPDAYRQLTVDQIDFPQRCLWVNDKTRDTRPVIIDTSHAQIFEQYVKKRTSRWVFPSSRMDGPISYTGVHKDFKKRARLAGIGKHITLRLLRRSFASRMGPKIGIYALKELMGHKHITTTERYMQSNLELMRDAADQDPALYEYFPATHIIQQVEKHIEKYQLDRDARFDFVKVKKAIVLLYAAIRSSVP